MPTVIGLKAGVQEGDDSLEMHNNVPYRKITRHRCYLVVADNINQVEDDIKVTSTIPQVGVTILSGAICSDVKCKETHSIVHPVTGVWATLWEVDCEFTTKIRNPNDVIPEVDWDTDEEKAVQEFDLITGARLMTTAGEPFFVERPIFDTVLKIRRRGVYPYDPHTIQIWNGRVNSMPFYGYPAGTCLLKLKISEDTQDGQRIVWEEYTVKIRVAWNFDGTMMANTWQGRQSNQGYMYREKAGGPARVNKDAHGQPMRVNLDGNGLKLKNDSGTFLRIGGTRPTSLNPAEGVIDNAGGTGAIIAQTSDVGSTIVIDPSSPVGWNPGNYTVIGVGNIAGSGPYWILDGDAGTLGALGGVWEIQRCPIYLFYNRAYPADINALSLGPF